MVPLLTFPFQSSHNYLSQCFHTIFRHETIYGLSGMDWFVTMSLSVSLLALRLSEHAWPEMADMQLIKSVIYVVHIRVTFIHFVRDWPWCWVLIALFSRLYKDCLHIFSMHAYRNATYCVYFFVYAFLFPSSNIIMAKSINTSLAYASRQVRLLDWFSPTTAFVAENLLCL